MKLTKQGVRDLNTKPINGKKQRSECIGGDKHDWMHDFDCTGCWASKYSLEEGPFSCTERCRRCGATRLVR